MSNEGLKKVFITKLTDTDTTDREGIGVIRFEGARIYKYVSYTDGAIAAVIGQVAYYHGDDSVVIDSAADVTSDLSASAEIGAGVLQAVIADTDFGWIQIKGVAVLSIALTAGADGDVLTPTGAGDGTLDVNVATAAGTHICAFAIDASAKIILCDFPW